MEKKIILSNERTYKSDDVKEASIENLKERALLLYAVLSFVFAIVGGGFIGLSFAFDSDITILTSGIMIIAVACFIWCFYLFVLMKIKKSDFKDTEYKYTFYEDEVVIYVNSTNMNQHMVLKYNDILKCIKSKKFTFLYFNKMQAFFFLNADLNDEVYKVLKEKTKNYKD